VDVVEFALIGLSTGALYAMVSLGLVLVYRGSGLLNFAQTGVVMSGAYLYYEVHERHGVPAWPAVIVTVVAGAALSALIHLVVLRPMRHTSPLARVIATLGVLVVLYSIAIIRYSDAVRGFKPILPTGTVFLTDSLSIDQQRIYIFGIGVILTAVLWLVYRYTAYGRVATAVSENELTAATLGYSPDRVATINWAAAGGIASFCGILIAPILYLDPTQLAITLMIFPLAAALLGGFVSFPGALVASLAIGVAQSELARYWDQPGVSSAMPFVLVIAYLVIRGRGVPVRGTILDRLPVVGSGRVRPLVVLTFYIGFAVLGFNIGIDWQNALTVTIATAIICLSVVVVSGYAGQLSLAQYVLAGVGALSAAKLSPHLPFVVCLLLAVAINLVVGFVVGLPALRTRGVTLAVVTFGLGVSLYGMVLSNVDFAGGQAGLAVEVPSLFGWDMDPFFQGGRYAFFALTLLVVLGVAVANLRRGAVGRQLLAVRSNVRAAAALGVNVFITKSYAFTLAAGIAAVGGVLLAFVQPAVLVNQFSVFMCITIVGVVVIGGMGSPVGALIGSTLVAGGITSRIFGQWESLSTYLPLLGGILLLVNLRTAPDGLFELMRPHVAPLVDRIDGLFGGATRRRRQTPVADEEIEIERVRAQGLHVEDLSVSFGGVKALVGVGLDVQPGEVHGLIGPNGAGKTTFIDAVTGFVATSSGHVAIGDKAIGRWPIHRRSRVGLARSFQSLELFADLTVEENLAIACEPPPVLRYVTDLIRPGRLRLTPVAREAVRKFELEGILDRRPDSISFGQRKLVAIARAVAAAPSVLLLDEPAAGLDDHEAAELAELIQELARDWGLAVLLVEHKIEMVMSVCDRVTVLANGQLLASGTPAGVRKNSAVIDAYLGTSPGASDASTLSEVSAAGVE
jgi:ABC-type branched-subunit amino acid transport system ATPase component/ABC-type branched-subunit amino acid transport system permease subunit